MNDEDDLPDTTNPSPRLLHYTRHKSENMGAHLELGPDKMGSKLDPFCKLGFTEILERHLR